MHTLGLAVDIRYTKNPWVSRTARPDWKAQHSRNAAFQTVTRNVSRLLSGTEEAMTPGWMHGLSV